jgi:archaellum component FlaG (FlaF/FlaG flagellin family)
VTYTLPTQLSQDHFYLEGNWTNFPDSMKLVSDNGKITLPYFAKNVHIVAAGKSQLQILFDGKSIKPEDFGDDMKNGTLHVSENRLYNGVSTSQAVQHTLEIVATPGLQVYTFTFG